jgi:hypothetical protein
VNATTFLSDFTVNDAMVLKMMPGPATGEQDERSRRYYSLRVGHNVLEQMRADHNEDFPNNQIQKISYGKYTEAMSDKGCSRHALLHGRVWVLPLKRPRQLGESFLTLFSEVRATFLELKAPV